MTQIVLLGEAGKEDEELLASCARLRHGDAEVEITTVREALDISSTPPLLYVSFLPCTQEGLLEVFAAMPLGAGQRVPFFQKVDSDDVPVFVRDLPVSGVFQTPMSRVAAENMLVVAASYTRFLTQNRDLISEVVKFRKQKHQLIKISTSLTSENDLDRLLELILAESRDIMSADAGSIYVRERKGPGKDYTDNLLFKIAQNDSIEIKRQVRVEAPIPIDENTVAGYVACTGKTLNIKDVYQLDESVPYRFGKDFDRRFSYRMKSMLTVPLKDAQNTIVGVVQLMNKKRDKRTRLTPESVAHEVVSFSVSEEDFVLSIASLAAVSIERAQLHEDIQHIFEGFLDESIATIDERDRVTSGHSRRVMGYAMAFVEAMNAANEGPFSQTAFDDVRKRQFKFAALLHDIGKIGVPEGLLTKETRVTAGEMEAILNRLDSARAGVLAGRTDVPWESAEQVDADAEFLAAVNRTGFLKDEELDRLNEVKDRFYFDSHGEKRVVLTDAEWEALAVRRGNLTAKERETINSHTEATRRILSKIPWTRELEGIPEIAAHHHEKLDGTGYPDRLTADQIDLESKILAVVDIYEALVAQDRPYKPAMPPDRALKILQAEVDAHHLDPEVVDFFVRNDIYKIFLDQIPPQTDPSS